MNRVSELDGIRGIAIILVLIWHYFTCQVKLDPDMFPLIHSVRHATALTWSGVDLFFVLSGFLIGGILLDNRHSLVFYKTFFVRRICRIFPLYFLMIIVFIVLYHVINLDFPWLFQHPFPMWSYLTFTQNYQMGFHNSFGPNWMGITWSLAIEEQFYLLLPFLIRKVRKPLLFSLLVLLICLGPFTRLFVDGLGSYVYTFCRSDALMTGVLIAWLVRQKNWWMFVHRFRIIITILAIGFLVFLLAWVKWRIGLSIGGIGNNFIHSWLALFYGTSILVSLLFPKLLISALLRNPMLTWFGLRSYCIYLLHQPVAGMVFGAARGTAPSITNTGDALLTLISLIITILIAEASFRYFESPIIRVGHQYRY